jgi:hypothetical protein
MQVLVDGKNFTAALQDFNAALAAVPGEVLSSTGRLCVVASVA